jgi:glycosyltransferase involved in cell wall biosynthesis
MNFTMSGREQGMKNQNFHVWYWVPEYPPVVGGTGQMASDLAEAIASDPELNIHVTVITSDGPGMKGIESKPRLDIHRLKIPFRVPHCLDATLPSLLVYGFKALIRGLAIARKQKPDLVHAFHVLPIGAFALPLARILGVPLVVTAIGAEIEDPFSRRSLLSHPVYRRALLKLARSASGVSAISQYIAFRLGEWGFSKTIVLPPGWKQPNPIESRSGGATFAPNPNQDPGASPGPWACVLVARLAKRKGVDLVLQAMSRLPFKDWRLHVIGDGPLRDSLEGMARDLGIADRVQFWGFVDEEQKFKVMRQSQVFVLPTLFEGFGIAYLEAMGCGLPVIASGMGGHRDFIEDGVNGLWVDPRTCEGLVEALTRLHQDPGWTKRLGDAARRTAEAYRVEKTALAYARWYVETITHARK